jgi:transcriptional regulator with XRE-family HTH domain
MDGGVGARLREARVQRGLDLAEVAAATKIQARFLGAIENEEWDLLPGEFYARSFIRGYATYLGVDDDGLAEDELRGPSRPAESAERLPRIDPAPPQPARSHRRRRPSPRRLAAIAVAGVAAVLAAAVLSSRGGDSTGSPPGHRGGGGQQAGASPSARSAAQGAGAILTLTATAEVWVCLLDGRGRALIDGQILDPGSRAGPYRSGGFTVSLGNGAVTMSVEGRPASIPATPNPIGFAIDRHGTMRELPEGERPTCT